MNQPTIPLFTGGQIPQLGAGTYKVDDADAQRVVEMALEIGYRHIDTAAMYGNEKGVGAGLRASGLAREDVFVTSKLDNPYHDPAEAHAAFDRTLEDLGTDYVDLYLIHWPLARRTDFVATWGALIEIWQSGRAKAIGVSNFDATHLKKIMGATGLAPAVDQIEAHPYLQRRDLREFCAEHRIAVTAWSPLGRGQVLADPAVVGVAERLGCTPAQAVLAWHLQRGDVVIPKSTHRERLEENFGALTVVLDDDAVAALDALDRGQHSGSSPEAADDRFDDWLRENGKL